MARFSIELIIWCLRTQTSGASFPPEGAPRLRVFPFAWLGSLFSWNVSPIYAAIDDVFASCVNLTSSRLKREGSSMKGACPVSGYQEAVLVGHVLRM